MYNKLTPPLYIEKTTHAKRHPIQALSPPRNVILKSNFGFIGVAVAESNTYRLEYTPTDVAFFSFNAPPSHFSGLKTCASSPQRSLFLSETSASYEKDVCAT